MAATQEQEKLLANANKLFGATNASDLVNKVLDYYKIDASLSADQISLEIQKRLDAFAASQEFKDLKDGVWWGSLGSGDVRVGLEEAKAPQGIIDNPALFVELVDNRSQYVEAFRVVLNSQVAPQAPALSPSQPQAPSVLRYAPDAGSSSKPDETGSNEPSTENDSGIDFDNVTIVDASKDRPKPENNNSSSSGNKPSDNGFVETTKDVERGLRGLYEKINEKIDAAVAKNMPSGEGDMGFMSIIAMLQQSSGGIPQKIRGPGLTEDGVFDSDATLQDTLVFLRTHVLNMPKSGPNDELWLYSPEIGAQLTAKYARYHQNLKTEEQKGLPEPEGFEKFVTNLDILHANGKISKKRVDLSPEELAAAGAGGPGGGFFGGIISWLKESFPGIFDMLAGLLKNFLGIDLNAMAGGTTQPHTDSTSSPPQINETVTKGFLSALDLVGGDIGKLQDLSDRAVDMIVNTIQPKPTDEQIAKLKEDSAKAFADAKAALNAGKSPEDAAKAFAAITAPHNDDVESNLSEAFNRLAGEQSSAIQPHIEVKPHGIEPGFLSTQFGLACAGIDVRFFPTIIDFTRNARDIGEPLNNTPPALDRTGPLLVMNA